MPFNYNDENKKLNHPPRFSPLPGSFLEVNTPPKRERNGDDSVNTPSYRKKSIGASPNPGTSPSRKSLADVPSEKKKKRKNKQGGNGDPSAGDGLQRKGGAEDMKGEKKKRKRRPRKKNVEGSEGQPKTPAKEKNNKSNVNTPAGQKNKKSSPVYEEYWTEEQVDQAVKEGKAHLAELRVNPYNRSEG